MAILPVGIGSAEEGGYQIERSLRFNSADSAYLNRTPASAGTSNRIFTVSLWTKLAVDGVQRSLFGANNGAGTADAFTVTSSGAFQYEINGGSSATLITTALHRDPSAWYHIVLAVDTNQATAADRVKIYVNGVQLTSFSTNTQPAQNYNFVSWNQNKEHTIGALRVGVQYFSGYQAEFYNIDGQALDPTSFGEFNSDTGVWQPKAYTGSYGTNGFYLNFSDNSGVTSTTLGADSSGNGNNWTPNNFSVTAGAGNDSLVDTPTPYGTDTGVGGEVRGNYCTASPLITFTSTDPAMALLNGNLDITRGGGGWGMCGSTIAVSTGKWYWEATFVRSGSGDGILGIHKTNTTLFQIVGYSGDPGGYSYGASGSKFNNTTGTAYGATYTNGDVIGVALDLDAGTLTFYKNNSSQGTAFSSLSGEFYPAFSSANGTGVGSWIANFGQRPFAYTAPSGFKALCTQNLPEPTIADGGQYFNTVTYTGDGASSHAITGVGFQPDLVWTKSRSGANPHVWIDSVRGLSKYLISYSTNAEGTDSTLITSFDSDGFTIGTDDSDYNNYPGETYVAWNWKANGAGVSNTAGTITSTVSANTDSGFSIVTYTGTGGSGTTTVGHGLSVAPAMVITKRRSTTGDWSVYHPNLTSTSYYLALNTTAAQQTYGSTFISPGSTTLTIAADSSLLNASGSTYVAYCFAQIPGYSAAFSYTGNGSVDGPFVFCNFRPAFVLVKRADGVENWAIVDQERSLNINPMDDYLLPNASDAEVTGSAAIEFDFLSNGFKVREDGAICNASGGTYIGIAFAENPFKYSLGR